jgi:putative membrane-bound dehydrogenase-like protein
MNRRLLIALQVLYWLMVTVLAADEGRELFDGKSLQGWQGNTDLWRVENGAIVGEIQAGTTLRRNEFLFWEGSVADFELTLEFKIEGGPSANSGIQFRSQRSGEAGAAGYQADLDQGAVWLGRIYDEHGRALLVERGSVVSLAPDGRRWKDVFAEPNQFTNLRNADGWTTYRILATGPHAEVWINGRRVSALDDHQIGQADYSGVLGFQLHSGPGPAKVQFRNVRLKELGKTAFPASAALAAAKDNRQTESPVLWHLRPNQPQPSSIDNSEAIAVVAEMKLVEGFRADLIAAEPDLHQPIAFTIDERGRLWVVEAFSYPNKQPAGAGKDRIRILADENGDGAFESKKTFAEGLNLVSGIELGFGGVWVGAAPELLFIPDRDANDAPDGPPEVLLDGFGYQDTHETLNSFVWGPDGWLYGNQGVFNTAKIGKPGARDADRTTLRAGIWRYHPTRHKFEVFAHGGSNQWGLSFNEIGDLFMTHCRSFWGGGGTTHVIRGGHFWNQTNSNYPAFISSRAPAGIPEVQNYLPASAKYDSGEGGAGKRGTNAVYGGHSHVGTMIYGGDNWPAIYRDHLFTHNLHGHQINHQINVRQGSGYETFHAGYDLAYVPNPAYIAVDLKYGPDGAVYVIDWVDRQHCHNPRPENWDRTNGRIYRIVWKETYKPKQVDLRKLNDMQCVELLNQPNRWYASMARRTLQYRAVQGTVDSSVATTLAYTLKTSQDRRAVLESLWTLHVIGKLAEEDIKTALVSEQDAVRDWAVRLATDLPTQLVTTNQLLELSQSDPSAKVRLAIASAMPTLDEADRWRITESLSKHAEDANDRFLPDMVWYGLAPIAVADIPRAIRLADESSLPSLASSIYWYVARNEAGRQELVAKLAAIEPEKAARLLRLFHFALQAESRLAMPRGWESVVARFTEGEPQVMARELSAVFGDERVLNELRTTLADSQAAIPVRRGALNLLSRVGDRDCIQLYPELLKQAELRGALLPLLGRSSDPAIASNLLTLLPSMSDDQKATALNVLTSRVESAKQLLNAIESKSLDKKTLTALHVRQMASLNNAELTKQLERIWGRIHVSSEDAKKMIAKVKNTYTTAPLWAYSAARGEQVYKKNCAACHPRDGTSVPLGPGLKGSWRNGLDYFLENIIDPNAVVGENYRQTNIVTKSGQVLNGLLDTDSETTVVLRTAEKTVSIPKSDIEERQLVDQSLMPTGLLDKMSEAEMIELLNFLLQRD